MPSCQLSSSLLLCSIHPPGSFFQLLVLNESRLTYQSVCVGAIETEKSNRRSGAFGRRSCVGSDRCSRSRSTHSCQSRPCKSGRHHLGKGEIFDQVAIGAKGRKEWRELSWELYSVPCEVKFNGSCYSSALAKLSLVSQHRMRSNKLRQSCRNERIAQARPRPS